MLFYPIFTPTGLQVPILARHPVTKDALINFDPYVFEVVKEAFYMVKLGLPVPRVIINIIHACTNITTTYRKLQAGGVHLHTSTTTSQPPTESYRQVASIYTLVHQHHNHLQKVASIYTLVHQHHNHLQKVASIYTLVHQHHNHLQKVASIYTLVHQHHNHLQKATGRWRPFTH